MLPVEPPLAPMLARLARELPAGDDLRFEPTWRSGSIEQLRGGR